MSLRRVLFSLMAWTALLLPAAADQPLPPATEWVSPQAVLCLEVTKPQAVLDVLLHPQLLNAIRTSPVYQQQANSDGFRQLRRLVDRREASADTPPQTVLARGREQGSVQRATLRVALAGPAFGEHDGGPHAARSELDRLVRARVDVHRELSALGEALRKWMGAATKADGGQFLPPPSAALASTRKTGPPLSPSSR